MLKPGNRGPARLLALVALALFVAAIAVRGAATPTVAAPGEGGSKADLQAAVTNVEGCADYLQKIGNLYGGAFSPATLTPLCQRLVGSVGSPPPPTYDSLVACAGNQIANSTTDTGKIYDLCQMPQNQQCTTSAMLGQNLDFIGGFPSTLGGSCAATAAASCPNLAGSWQEASNSLGTQGQGTSIMQSGCNLTFTNEYGQPAAGHFADSTDVVADGWSSLAGSLSQPSGNSYNSITWANGTAWSRTGTASAGNCPNLAGNWQEASNSLGTKGFGTSIAQSGCNLTFTNEYGQPAAGHFADSTDVVADGWGSLAGSLSQPSGSTYSYITWANGTAWSRRGCADTAPPSC